MTATQDSLPTVAAPAVILAGGGEMGALMRSVDWTRTPVGPVDQWPQSLRTALSIVLDSRYPMYISWGPEFVQFYNDAYRPVLGSKHPDALGRSTYDTWSEIWEDIVGPLFRKVKAEGDATYLEDFLFPLHRYGYTEECYFTFCYSPIREESGAVGGVFVTCIETTARMVGERRLRTLRELAARASEARTPADACRSAASVLAANTHDFPLAAIYLIADDEQSAHLAGVSGLGTGHAATPAVIDLTSDTNSPWPLGEVVDSANTVVMNVLDARVGPLPGGPWPEEPTHCAVIPVPRAGQEGVAAIVVAGLSARRAFDDDYRGFLDLVAGHLARAIANARTHEEERKRAEALAEIDRAKTAFFSNVSHEFRTPLTLLLGPTEEVLADPKGSLDESYRDRLVVAHRNALRLLRLVNTLLDFSRIEAGRVEAVYEPTDIGKLTAELASGFRSAIERAGLRFVVDCAPLDDAVYLDRDMWEKIVLNLLSNALKHTFDGEIGVTVRRVGDEAELVVRDTGVGIPAEDLPRIFERFHRVAGTPSRTHEGSGIGLALVYELVRLHAGTVDVESRQRHGSAFRVRLPLGAAHLPADHVDGAQQRTSIALGAAPFVEEALRWLPDEPSPTTGERSAAPAAQTSRAKPAADLGTRPARILLADDNADMREYITRLVAERGWIVDGVADGRTALEHALAEPPDLVVTDVMMPGLDGFELLRALRADPATRTVPVLVVSARAGEEAQVQGLDAGADDYLIKPFTAQELLARIKTHLTLARVRREAEEDKTRLLDETRAAKAELETKAEELEQTATELEAQSEELRFATEELQEANQRLSVSETRLRLANAAAGIGTWELDVLTGELVCDDQCRSVLGLAPGPLVFDDLHNAAHADDRVRLREMLAQANKHEKEDRHTDFDAEFRLADTGGQLRWAGLTGRTLFGVVGAGERPVRIVGTVHDITTRRRAEDALREKAQVVETIHRVGTALTAQLDLSSLVQMVTDEATKLTGAELGVFEPTFRDTGVVRSDDITRDERHGKNAPFHRMPDGQLPVVSYLAVPVISRSGEVLGGLFFGHSERGVFAERHERLAVGVAGWAAVGIDNARLYDRERRARGDAETARADAEQANRAKTEFLATMSHELRTPLNAIAGYVDLLGLEIRGPITALQRDDLRRIQRSQQHLLSLINDILNFARLEAGHVEFNLTRVALSGLLSDTEQLIAPQVSAKGLTYDGTDCDASLSVQADPEKLRQIVLNLLTNAVKFTESGGRIAVSCHARDALAEVRISDTGRGIPVEKLESIFEPFVQVDRHLTPTGNQGIGLGLAISRDLARGMGGNISVESRVGSGSTFTLSLPRDA